MVITTLAGATGVHAAAVIKLLVTRLRRAWPHTRLIVRADSALLDANPAYEASKAAQVISAALAKDPDLAGVFATNLFTAQGVATGVKQANKSGQVKVVGFDAARDVARVKPQPGRRGVPSGAGLLAHQPDDLGRVGHRA